MKEIVRDEKVDNYEQMSVLLHQKKAILAEKKKKYSELTSAHYRTNQDLIRMQKALKNQTSKINAATATYVDVKVSLAKAQAERDYSERLNVSSEQFEFDESTQLEEISKSRESLQEKLDEYRELKTDLSGMRDKFASHHQRLRQECLNVGYFCRDARTKVSADIKKKLDRAHFDPTSASKTHGQNLNKTTMTIANRVLDCREEVLGFFRTQILKMKREERISQEQKALSEERNLSKEDSEAATESEVNSFVKKQRLFNTKDEIGGGSTDGEQNSNCNVKNPVPPKEPPSSSVPPNLLNAAGRGNMVGTMARQKRKDRASPWSAVNVDRIGDDLIRGCEVEGVNCKLKSLKQALQSHLLYQLCLILFLEKELRSEKYGDGNTDSMCNQREDIDANNNVEEVNYKATVETSKSKKKNSVGQCAKLCAINNEALKNDDSYIQYGSHYIKELCTELEKMESSVVDASNKHEEALYSACISGIGGRRTTTSNDPVNDETKYVEVSPSKASGYISKSVISLRTRKSLRESQQKSGEADLQDGLSGWITKSKFEEKMKKLLSAEVRSMKSVPIELGLAKLASIHQTSSYITLQHAQEKTSRERATIAMALKGHISESPILPNSPEKKVCIEGLEKL